MSGAPFPEVRNSHLAGVLERKRAREALVRIESKRAKRERKRARKLARKKEAESRMNQQTLPSSEPARKTRKRPQRKPLYLEPHVTERLVQMINAPGGRQRMVDLYAKHAPSKADSTAPKSAVDALARKHERGEPYSMEGETVRIWMAIYKGEAPPNVGPLPAPAIRDVTRAAPGMLVDANGVATDVRSLIREEIAAAIRGASLGAEPDVEQQVSEVKHRVNTFAKALGVDGAHGAVYGWVYIHYQARFHRALPEGNKDESTLRKVATEGHISDLLSVVKDLLK